MLEDTVKDKLWMFNYLNRIVTCLCQQSRVHAEFQKNLMYLYHLLNWRPIWYKSN